MSRQSDGMVEPRPTGGRGGSGDRRYPSTGRCRRRRNVLPSGPVHSRSRSPCMARAYSLAKYKPRPVPACPARDWLPGIRPKRVKSLARWSSCMPVPKSRTRTTAHPLSEPHVTEKGLPTGEYLAALSTTLASTCRIRSGSPSATSSGGPSRSIFCPRYPPFVSVTTRSIIGTRSRGTARGVATRASTRANARRSSTRRFCRSAASTMRDSRSRRWASSSLSQCACSSSP